VVPLIGREHELSRPGELLDDMAGGRGSVVVLSGEPVIGKSRIACELLARAEPRFPRAVRDPPARIGAGCPSAPVPRGVSRLAAAAAAGAHWARTHIYVRATGVANRVVSELCDAGVGHRFGSPIVLHRFGVREHIEDVGAPRPCCRVGWSFPTWPKPGPPETRLGPATATTSKRRRRRDSAVSRPARTADRARQSDALCTCGGAQPTGSFPIL
jgi:hypothetical protein